VRKGQRVVGAVGHPKPTEGSDRATSGLKEMYALQHGVSFVLGDAPDQGLGWLAKNGAEGGPQSVLHGRSFVCEEVRRSAMETGSTEVRLKLPACCVKFFRFPAMWHISALPTGSPARDGLFAWAFSSVSAAFPAQLRFWPSVWLPGQFRIQR